MSQSLSSRYSKVDSDEDVTSHSSAEETNIFAPRSSVCGPRFQMATFLILGVALMITHHCVFLYLDGKSVDSLQFEMRGLGTGDQSMVSILGNTIAYAARAVLSGAIGVAFIQLLWMNLRRRQYPVTHIDALVACRGAPFALSALPTWRYSFLLALTASTVSLMAFISIVAPGSLRIISLDREFDCTVPTVSLDTSDIALVRNSSNNNVAFQGSKSLIPKLAGRVLMVDGPLPPLNTTSNCNDPYNYHITFHAPTANCTSIELGTNMLPRINPVNGQLLVWSAEMAQKLSDGLKKDFKFVAAARKLTDNSTSAVTCDTYNGTYTVAISHSSTTPSTARVVRAVWNGPINASETVNDQYYAISTAFVNLLQGTVDVDLQQDDGISIGDNSLVGWSPAFAGTSTKPWSPPGDLATTISSFMQNISVSLLSEEFHEMGGVVASVNTKCLRAASVYDYNQTQLFGTYGAALGVTAICVFFGFWAVKQNGVEETFSFSRLAGAILNKSLFEDRYQLTDGSQLTANGNENGQLRLIHTPFS